MNYRAFALLLCLGLLTSACSTPTPLNTTPDKDGLSQIESQYFDELYRLPNLDLTQYHKILFEPLQVSYSDQKRGYTFNSRAKDFQFDDKELAIFREKFTQAFSQQWQNNPGWTQTSQPGPDVLVVQASVSELYLYGSIKNNRIAPNTTLTNETSKMLFTLKLIDSESGKTLLRISDRKITGHPGTGIQDMQAINSIRYWQDAYQAFRQLATGLQRTL